MLKIFSKEELNAAKAQVLWQSQALDLSTACLMVLNEMREVTYVNAAMQRLVAANSTHFQHFFTAAAGETDSKRGSRDSGNVIIHAIESGITAK